MNRRRDGKEKKRKGKKKDKKLSDFDSLHLLGVVEEGTALIP